MSIEKMRKEDRTLVGEHTKGSDKALSGRKEEKTGKRSISGQVWQGRRGLLFILETGSVDMLKILT